MGTINQLVPDPHAPVSYTHLDVYKRQQHTLRVRHTHTDKKTTATLT